MLSICKAFGFGISESCECHLPVFKNFELVFLAPDRPEFVAILRISKKLSFLRTFTWELGLRKIRLGAFVWEL